MKDLSVTIDFAPMMRALEASTRAFEASVTALRERMHPSWRMRAVLSMKGAQE
jgi:hypothetical protein